MIPRLLFTAVALATPAVALAFATGPGATPLHAVDAPWTIQPSPNATASDELLAVSADSASDAWAVGTAFADRPRQ